MPKFEFSPSAITANMINALSSRELQAFVKAAPKFAKAVESGRSASIKVGPDVFVAGKTGSIVTDVFFDIGGTRLDPQASGFDAAAVVRAAATGLILTPSAEQLRLTSDNNVVTAPAGALNGIVLSGSTSLPGDAVRDNSLTDSDALTAIVATDLVVDLIENVETVNLTVQTAGLSIQLGRVGASPRDPAVAGVIHARAATVALSSASTVRSIDELIGINDRIGLSFAPGTWTVGTLSRLPSSLPQELPITLSGTTLNLTSFGTQAASGGPDTDVDILRLVSAGTSPNLLDLGAGPVMNQPDEAIVVTGTADLTLQTDVRGADGLEVTTAGFTGRLTLRIDAASPTAQPLDLSEGAISVLRLDADARGGLITLRVPVAQTGTGAGVGAGSMVAPLTVDVRRDQTAGLKIAAAGDAPTTGDALAIRLTDEAPASGAVGAGVANLGGAGLDLSGLATDGSAANHFETVTLTLAGTTLVNGSQPHRLGAIKGGVVNGTSLNVIGSTPNDAVVIDSLDGQIVGFDASRVAGAVVIDSVNLLASRARTFVGGTGPVDRIGVITHRDDAVLSVSLTGAGAAAVSELLVADAADGNVSLRLRGFEDVTLGSGNDLLNGSAGGDRLGGGLGNDTLVGGAGADTLNGGEGDDTFRYAAVSDLFASGALVDSIVGGAGDDDSILFGSNGVTAISIGVADSFSTRISGVEAIKVEPSAQPVSIVLNNNARERGLVRIDLSGDTDPVGSNLVDVSAETSTSLGSTLIGSAGVDDLRGGAANDSLAGGEGDDVFRGGLGADTIDGGAGVDTYIVGGTTAISVTLNGSAAVTVTMASGGNDTVLNIENVTGSSGNDSIIGDLADNLLLGGAGNDGLRGGAGNDRLEGGHGGDTLSGGPGSDSLSGGSGADTFTFAAGDAGLSEATLDVVQDFSAVDDALSFGGPTGAVTNLVATAGTALADFAAAKMAADALLDGSIRYVVVFNVNGSGNGLLFFDRDLVDAGGQTYRSDEAVSLLGVALVGALTAPDLI